MFQNTNIHRKKSLFTFLLVTILMVSTIFITVPQVTKASSQKINSQSKLSEGVHYKNINYNDGSINNHVNVLEVNLSDQFTQVQLGKSNPLNKLESVRA